MNLKMVPILGTRGPSCNCEWACSHTSSWYGYSADQWSVVESGSVSTVVSMIECGIDSKGRGEVGRAAAVAAVKANRYVLRQRREKMGDLGFGGE